MISIINLIIIAIMTLQSLPSCKRETIRNNNVYLDFPQSGLSFTLSTDTHRLLVYTVPLLAREL